MQSTSFAPLGFAHSAVSGKPVLEVGFYSAELTETRKSNAKVELAGERPLRQPAAHSLRIAGVLTTAPTEQTAEIQLLIWEDFTFLGRWWSDRSDGWLRAVWEWQCAAAWDRAAHCAATCNYPGCGRGC